MISMNPLISMIDVHGDEVVQFFRYIQDIFIVSGRMDLLNADGFFTGMNWKIGL
jgi:hypothetical protein